MASGEEEEQKDVRFKGIYGVVMTPKKENLLTFHEAVDLYQELCRNGFILSAATSTSVPVGDLNEEPTLLFWKKVSPDVPASDAIKSIQLTLGEKLLPFVDVDVVTPVYISPDEPIHNTC